MLTKKSEMGVGEGEAEQGTILFSYPDISMGRIQKEKCLKKNTS